MTKESKKNLLTTLKITLVLLAIAVVSAAILGCVNYFTKIDEDAVFMAKLTEAYQTDAAFKNLEIDENNGIYRAYEPQDGTKTLVMVSEGSGAYKSTLQILVVISNDRITKIQEFKSKETPGLGSNAFKDRHIGQYMNIDITAFDEFHVSKNATAINEVDAVSGATKSSNAVTEAVNNAIKYYKKHYDIPKNGIKAAA